MMARVMDISVIKGQPLMSGKKPIQSGAYKFNVKINGIRGQIIVNPKGGVLLHKRDTAIAGVIKNSLLTKRIIVQEIQKHGAEWSREFSWFYE